MLDIVKTNINNIQECSYKTKKKSRRRIVGEAWIRAATVVSFSNSLLLALSMVDGGYISNYEGLGFSGRLKYAFI